MDTEDITGGASILWIYLHRFSKLSPRSLWIRQKNYKLEEQCRVLCDKVVHHRLNKADIDHTPIKTPTFREIPSTDVISCFSEMSDILFDAHPELYTDIIFKLNVQLQDERAVCKAYSDFAENLFSKSVSWPLIASLLTFSGGLAVECTRNGRSILVRQICDWTTVFIIMKLREWLLENGGWEGVLNMVNANQMCSTDVKSHSIFRAMPNNVKAVLIFFIIGILVVSLLTFL